MCKPKCNVITLDSGLNESYVRHLEEGKTRTVNFNTFKSQYQRNAGQVNLKLMYLVHEHGINRCLLR